jgi:CzcA family heavy metal efflux pump
MLNRIIEWALHNRWLMMLLAFVLLGYGIYTATGIPVDVFPDFAPVQVVIQTEAPGYAPEEVESLITLPLESAVNGTANVKVVRSVSTVGLSVITIIFEDATNIFTARQLVTEKLQALPRALPTGVQQPRLAPISTAVGDIIKLGLVAQGPTSELELRTLADWTIRMRLMAIPGVSNVVIYGKGIKQYQVLVDPNKLKDYNLSLQAVVDAAQKSNANAAGGFLRTPEKEYLIRGLGRVQSTEEIAKAVIANRNGLPITLGNVATIQVGPAYNIGDAIINGKPGVILNITKQPWANTLQTTYAIEGALKDLALGFPKDVKMVPVFRQADFIEVAVKNVMEALVLGGILVVIILFVFLQNWRTAVISLTAIPLSLLTAIIALKWQGGTINTMTLGGLAIAIGEVVDDAIIDVENVYRRLRENQLLENPRHPIQVVYDASREIRTSVVYATYIVALVFLPIFSLGGLEGKIFMPLGFSYIVSIVASLGIALTVTPAMCYLLLARQKNMPHEETKTIHWLKRQYQGALRWSLTHPKAVLVSAILLFLVSLLPLAFLGKAFLPEFDESNVIVSANSIPGTSLDITTQAGKVLTQEFMKDKGVMASGQRAGRAEGSDDYGGSNFSEYDLRLQGEGVDKKELLAHLREHFAKVPGIVVNVGSYISHRMDHVLSGVNAAIAIKIFGPDLDVLHQKAQQIEAVMKTVPGAVDVQVEPIIPIPEIAIRINRDIAAQYGVQVGDLVQSIEAAFKGETVSQVLEGQKTFDLFVWFEPQYRNNLDVIRATLIDTPTGAKVPIGSIAEVAFGTSPNTIRHENVSRNVVIQANVAGRDLGGVINEARQKISGQIPLDAGYYVVYGGQFEAQEQASKQLLILSVVAILGILVLLVMALQSFRAAIIVMANLPLALIGGIWAIFLSGGVLSIGSLVGFITLFGISTRNGIMLVTHFNYMLGEGHTFEEVLWEGSQDRLAPVLMTALTAGLGVLPIAILGGAGRELEQPLAIVILGGMVTSTGLTLLVIPALFKLYGRKALHSITIDHKNPHEAEERIEDAPPSH